MTPEKVILGIVAEYDPFHNGHAYHLGQARRMIRPDAVYTVLSPCIKQRGELSLFSPYLRAACAVRAGADAVFSLPVLWTVRDAEHYAFGAVSLLCGLGITHLAFGAETADLGLLSHVADFLEDPPSAYTDMLRELMKGRTGYPSAVSKAISFFLPDSSNVLSLPNNILGICYLRALKKLRSSVIPVIIPRHGSYHSLYADPVSPSASALRKALLMGNYHSVWHAVPPFSAHMMKQAFLSHKTPDYSLWNALLINVLRTKDLSMLPDISGGLDTAIRKAAASSSSREELIENLSTKRVTVSRISRLFAMAALGVTNERIRLLPPPAYTQLLALNRNRALTERWQDLPVCIFPSAVSWSRAADPEDILSWRLWAECCRLPDTLPFSEKVYTE